MPKQKLAFEPGGKPRLELEWGGYMREFKVKLDGEMIGQIDGGQRELKQGREFDLPDGSLLEIKLHQTQLLDELQVMRNGEPVPGSAADPRQKISAAVRSPFIWGVLAILGGIALWVTPNPWLLILGFSRASVIFGVLLIGLSVAISRHIWVAAPIALVICIVDWLISVYAVSEAGLNFNFLATTATVLRFFNIVPLLPGMKAIQLVESMRAPAEAES